MAYQYQYPIFQAYQPYQQQMQQQQPQLQIQNGGFVSVRNEFEARSYPVAPGNSVTFKDENAPYIYTKTMGFSQLDRPLFEKYRLEKEEVAPEALNSPQNGSEASKANTNIIYAEKAEFEPIRSDVKALWKEIDEIKRRLRSYDQSDADSANVANDKE